MFIDTAKKLEESLFLGDLEEVSRKTDSISVYWRQSVRFICPYSLGIKERLQGQFSS